MAADLTGAVCDRYDATVKVAMNLPWGLLLDLHQEETDRLPIVVLQHTPPGGAVEHQMCAHWTETGLVTFFVFAETANAASQIAQEVRRVFAANWGLIAPNVAQFLHTRYLLAPEDALSFRAERVFRAEVEYEYILDGSD